MAAVKSALQKALLPFNSSINKRSYHIFSCQVRKTTGAAGCFFFFLIVQSRQILFCQHVTGIVARSKFPYLADDNIYHRPCVCSSTIQKTKVVKDEAQRQRFICSGTIGLFDILSFHFGGCTAGPDSLLHQAWFGSMQGEVRRGRRGGKEDHSAGAECGSSLWRNRRCCHGGFAGTLQHHNNLHAKQKTNNCC